MGILDKLIRNQDDELPADTIQRLTAQLRSAHGIMRLAELFSEHEDDDDQREAMRENLGAALVSYYHEYEDWFPVATRI